MQWRAVAVLGVFGVECVGIVYVGLVVLAIATWAGGEGAAELSSADWLWHGVRRMMVGLLAAGGVAGVALVLNRLITDHTSPMLKRAGRWMAAAGGLIVALLAVGGTVWFILAHPMR